MWRVLVVVAVNFFNVLRHGTPFIPRIIHPLTHSHNAAEACGAALCPMRRSLFRLREAAKRDRASSTAQETKEIASNVADGTKGGGAN